MDKGLLSNFQSELWMLSCKLKGIGELIALQEREPALDENDVALGIGSIIREIGDRLDDIQKEIDEGLVKDAQKKKSQSKLTKEKL